METVKQMNSTLEKGCHMDIRLLELTQVSEDEGHGQEFPVTCGYGIPLKTKVESYRPKIRVVSPQFTSLSSPCLGAEVNRSIRMFFVSCCLPITDTMALLEREEYRPIHPSELLDLLNQTSFEQLYGHIVLPGVKMAGDDRQIMAFARIEEVSSCEIGIVQEGRLIAPFWAIPCVPL